MLRLCQQSTVTRINNQALSATAPHLTLPDNCTPNLDYHSAF